jgi:hypothetical protein
LFNDGDKVVEARAVGTDRAVLFDSDPFAAEMVDELLDGLHGALPCPEDKNFGRRLKHSHKT